MLIYFLQTHTNPVLPNLQSGNNTKTEELMGYNCYFDSNSKWASENQDTIAELLAGFFLFYSYFDYQHYAICIRFGKPTLKSMTLFEQDLIVVEDPFETGNCLPSLINCTDFNCTRLMREGVLERMIRCLKQAYITLIETQDINQLLVDSLKPRVPRARRRRRNGRPTNISRGEEKH